MRICFLLSGLSRSGGFSAVLEHGRHLRDLYGYDVTLILLDADHPADDWGLSKEFTLLRLQDLTAEIQPFDVAIATYWETALWIHEIPAHRHAQFVQSLEDRFFPARSIARTGARISLGMPLEIITEAEWIADVLGQMRPDHQIHLAPNGIDKQVFSPLGELPPPHDGPLRIVVEGHPLVWFKSVPEAKRVIEAMTKPHDVVYIVPTPEQFGAGLSDGRAVGPLSSSEMAEHYEWADVILKLSRVEGMFGPPLEAFHKGATCVVWPVTGHDQYIEHHVNGIVAGWDDIGGTARWLDLLAENRELLARMQGAALETARSWPSWQEAALPMHEALNAIRAAPAGGDPASMALMAESIRGALGPMDRYAATMGIGHGGWSLAHHRLRRFDRLFEKPGIRTLQRIWRAARGGVRRLRGRDPEEPLV